MGSEYSMRLMHVMSWGPLAFRLVQVLVDVVSLIKSLASVMTNAEHLLGPSIRLYLHARVQQVVQGDMVPILHRVDKHKVGKDAK